MENITNPKIATANKMIEAWQKNISFLKERIALQESGESFEGRRYQNLDIEIEQDKINKAFQVIYEELRKDGGWTICDGDNFQFGKQVSEKVFIFKEFNRDEFPSIWSSSERENLIYSVFNDTDYWEELEIDLDKYLADEVQKHLSAYYDGIGEVISIYGEQANWIIAECIFEQESGLY